MSNWVTLEETRDAIKKGFLNKVSTLAENEMTNEITEDAAAAERQFSRGLKIAIDGLDHCMTEATKISS